MEKSVNGRNYSLVLKCLAIMLVMALMTNFTLSANAAAAQGKYVREVIIVTASTYQDAVNNAAKASEKTDDKRTYYVCETPIYDSNEINTYLCYSTTNKASLALTSIKAMNMEGGWSYDEYDKYLDELWSKAGLLVEDMLTAVREYNVNLAAKTPNAEYAKGVLDLLYEDDSKQTVSAFFAEAGTKAFADTAKEEDYKTRMTTFVMESNTSILCSIENALMLACADSYKGAGNNLFDGMEQSTFLASVNGMKGYTQYDAYAADIINSLPDVQKAITFYENSGHPYTATMEEVAAVVEEEAIAETDDEYTLESYQKSYRDLLLMILDEELDPGFDEEQMEAVDALLQYELYLDTLSAEDKSLYATGRMLYTMFSECEYTGYKDENGEREYTNFLDLVMKYDLNDPLTPAENYQKSDFYPMISLMSAGQRAMIKVGLMQFVSSIVTEAEQLDSTKALSLKVLNEQAEEGEEIVEGDTVSVYYGVDRSLFEKDSGIALTSKAIAESKEKPLGESQAKYRKMDNIANQVLIASSATSVVSLSVTFILVAEMADGLIVGNTAQSLFGIMADVGSEETFLQCLATSFGGIAGSILWAVNFISIAALIISLVIKLVSMQKGIDEDKPYVDIPRVMCSYQPVFSESGGDTEEDYIYYYGVKNPLLSRVEQGRASRVKGSNGESVDILKYMVGDVSDWGLSGSNREWIALYASTDKRAGNPILADSFVVTADPLAIKDGLVAVQKFNYGAPYDLHTYLRITMEEDAEGRYIGYRMESTQSSAASVFSEVSPLGTLVVGVLAGGALGTLITYFVAKKRKNKAEALEG